MMQLVQPDLGEAGAATRVARPSDKPCRILALPGRLPDGNTPFVDLLHQGLRQRGFVVQDWRSFGRLQEADILQVHWPEAVFWNRLSRLHPRGARFAAERLLANADRVKAAGGAVVWTVHDLSPHDGIAPAQRDVWEDFLPRFLARIDAVISLSRVGLQEAGGVHPMLRGKPSLVVPHPHFRNVFSPLPSREAARRALALPETGVVLCSVGQIRHYKGLLPLIEIFGAARTEATLVVAGNCQDRALADALRAAGQAAGGSSVRLDLRVLTEREIVEIHAAADLAVFNFASILNSGSVLTALSLDTPVLAPARGSLLEVAEAVGPDWMRVADGLTPDTLRDAVAWVRDMPGGSRAPLADFEPAELVRRHADFYRTLLA